MVGVILARFQPIHNGHIALIKQAMNENEKVLILIGSADKFNKRNPIPIDIRVKLVRDSVNSKFNKNEVDKITIVKLDDLTNETDNSHDWGFYLYAKIVTLINTSAFRIYYSDGFEIITTWFPGFIMKNYVSLSLLARGNVEDGISATQVRELILNENLDELKKVVPLPVFEMKDNLKAFINIAENHITL